MMNSPNLLHNMYGALFDALGPSRWWPGDSPFEVAVGAVLTQNTSWRNVEKALDNLKREDALSPAILWEMAEARLAELIRPAGYFRLKAARLKNFLAFLEHEAASNGHPLDDPGLGCLGQQEDGRLRAKLLRVKGVGPETADSILLYALDRPAFVVDAYTHRILNRHLLVPEDADYHETQEVFTSALREDTALFKEYHALLVRAAKTWCKKKQAACQTCPLASFLT
jgi:endonuclease-3 related protein